MTDFSADWLALRETADRAARDPALARRFAALLPPGASLLDLGAGTGANARALTPLLPGDETWTLAERDPALRAAQAAAMRAWAGRGGGHVARLLPLAIDLAGGLAALDGLAADAVVASAFFDLAGMDWLARFAGWLARRRLPLYATLTVDGRRTFTPPDEDDALVAAAFRQHQTHDKGLGPAAGPAALACLEQALAAEGYEVATAPSDWRLGPEQAELLAALVAGEATAARDAAPADAPCVSAWEGRRRRALASGRLSAIIGHRDLLAWPRQICEKASN
jgi:hypothetical protein